MGASGARASLCQRAAATRQAPASPDFVYPRSSPVIVCCCSCVEPWPCIPFRGLSRSLASLTPSASGIAQTPDIHIQGSTTTMVRGQLTEDEIAWRDRQPWLEEHGYMLRPRYRQDWKPSWEGTTKSHLSCEDGRMLRHPHIIDATRILDGALVTLKMIEHSVHPYEVEIARMFCEEPMKSDPRNHCVQILEVLQDPIEQDISIIIMPILKAYHRPRFDTVGEAVDFFRQTLEGLQFIHQHRIAHRDISMLNVMMDPLPLYPKLYHPTDDTMTRDFSRSVRPYTRTERPTRYYFIDFGLSRKYGPEDEHPLELPIFGGDKTVPEFQDDGYDKASDPFATDIYYLGNRFREEFLKVASVHCSVWPYANIDIDVLGARILE
ncbi:uncharacterized protein B0H18DRAFT_1025159 [Fomitopsis serialis]|uniref:uncharacterized protein n=1 Tax=Fomitopsis serialis TaxID=139415 RepID=UPI00200776AB|nr:uncharacterized protein B0H18DRAFT_1025159 [Neoantrodia serialis]KAH9920119.1 hypothetical protein B0H18DRAFT_1025159 [Neoantrodia serialis]